MDLSKFSLIKETPSEMHVKHPSGKTLVLNKAAMSDKAKSLVKKMACGGEVKGYSDGTGDVEDTSHIYGADDVDNKIQQENQHAKEITTQDTSTSNTTDVRTPEQKERAKAAAISYGYADGGQVGQNTILAPQDNPVENAMQVNLPQAQPSVASAAPTQVQAQAPQDPMVQAKLSEYELLNKQERDVNDLSAAQQGSSKNVTAAYNDYADSMDDSVQNPNDLVKDMEAKDKVLAQAFMSNKIDPDRYWNNKSTASKILAGISVGLGGIAAGYNGGKNPAMDYFNNAINNDIDAQKNEQGKSQSLWKMNREAFGDDMRANLATQNQLYTGLQAKLAKAAAQVQAPEAKFHASQLLDQIEQKKIDNRQRLGLLTQGMSGQSGGGNLVTSNPLMLATDPNIVPQDEQKEVINQLGKAKYVADHADELRQAYAQAEKEQTIAQRVGRFGYEGPAMKNLRLLGAPLLKDNDGRVNENAIKTFEDILPGPLERESTALSKKDAFNKFLNMHSDAPAAEARGLDPKRFQSTSTDPVARLQPQEKAIYNWAKANPSDPRAAAAMTKFQGMGIK